jgi:HAD superfamily hydrolase (TIGR01509 family)
MDQGVKKTMKVECVIYDCDGVLFDSLEANRTLYNHIAVSMGRGPVNEEEIAYCHMHTVRDSIRFLFKDDPEGEAKALEFLAQRIDFKDYVPYLRMEPNVLPTLTTLREKKILTAICTNRSTSMPHLMERFALDSYFDMVVTALDVARPKPDPESVDKILKGLRMEAPKTLYVGDSEIDRKTALASGVCFVAYKNRDISTGLVIDDHREILDLID